MRALRPLAAAPLAAALLLASLLSACTSSADGDAASDTTVAETADAAAFERLAGRWAHFDVVAYEDEVLKTLIISTGFADLEPRDGELWNQMTFCHADVGSAPGIEVSIADEATRAILPVATPVEVSEVDGKLRVVRPPTPTPIGIDLADPANEPLPTDPADPRIFDADGDGNPGVTSSISIGGGPPGQVYIARREIFSYDVTEEGPDRLVGTITDDSEQLVVGASDSGFLSPTNWRQLDDPARNPVIWVRVDDTWDCERLAEERDRLFPPNPTVDW